MEYTELSAYDLPSGIVTTWAPATDPAAGADAWCPDRRALSPSHHQHLAHGETGSWIGGVMRVPAPLVADTLIRALRAWFARHEALRADVVRSATDLGWERRLVAAEHVRIEHELLGERSSAQALTEIERFFAAVGPVTWPHCVFATISEPGADSFTLAFGADHSVMDAYSQLLWFDEIASLYARAAAGESDDALARTGSASHLDHADAEAALAADLDREAPAVARWRDFLAADGFPRCPGIDAAGEEDLARPRQDGGTPQSSFSTWLVDARRADAFKQLCKAGGGSLQAGLIAVLAQVLREQHGSQRLRLVVPMHTRLTLEHATAIGWYVGLCPLDLDLAGHPDLAHLLAHVQSQLAANRDLVAQPFARVMELLGVEDGPKFAVSYVDGRFVPGASNWADWQARALRSQAYAHDEVYVWFGRTEQGLNLSARYPTTMAAERTLRDLVAGVTALIDALAATALVEETVTA
jgi:hypothetical protein